MSLVSTRHTVQLFESGKSEALTGQRLAKVGYKTTKNQAAKFPSICVSLPHVNLGEEPLKTAIADGKFNHVIKAWLEDTQDKIIRSLYESSAGSLSSVSDDDVSYMACLNYHLSEQSGGRLTKEFLESWFDENVLENLTTVIADKLGFDLSTPEQETTLKAKTDIYRDIFSSISGNKTILESAQQKAVTDCLKLSSTDDSDSVHQKIVTRLAEVSRRKSPDLMDLGL